jgi:hypothetical protein
VKEAARKAAVQAAGSTLRDDALKTLTVRHEATSAKSEDSSKSSPTKRQKYDESVAATER